MKCTNVNEQLSTYTQEFDFLATGTCGGLPLAGTAKSLSKVMASIGGPKII